MVKETISDIERKIKEIIQDQSPSLAEKSKRIMRALREDYIVLPPATVKSYMFNKSTLVSQLMLPNELEFKSGKTNTEFDAYKESVGKLVEKIRFYHNATIDPDVVIEDSMSPDNYKIYGNSFGPFLPEEYFESDNLRVLWILKESYIGLDSFLKEDRGEHDQAKEYLDYVNTNHSLGSGTMSQVYSYSEALLHELGKVSNTSSSEEILKHICILNVNYFPGLAFNSMESDENMMRKWAEKNKSLLGGLIRFYDPKIIIWGHTLEYYLPKEDYCEIHKQISEKTLSLWEDKIKEWRYISADDESMVNEPSIDENSKNAMTRNVGKNIKYLSEKGVIHIQANHPSYPYKKELILKDAEQIREWLGSI